MQKVVVSVSWLALYRLVMVSNAGLTDGERSRAASSRNLDKPPLIKIANHVLRIGAVRPEWRVYGRTGKSCNYLRRPVFGCHGGYGEGKIRSTAEATFPVAPVRDQIRCRFLRHCPNPWATVPVGNPLSIHASLALLAGGKRFRAQSAATLPAVALAP